MGGFQPPPGYLRCQEDQRPGVAADDLYQLVDPGDGVPLSGLGGGLQALGLEDALHQGLPVHRSEAVQAERLGAQLGAQLGPLLDAELGRILPAGDQEPALARGRQLGEQGQQGRVRVVQGSLQVVHHHQHSPGGEGPLDLPDGGPGVAPRALVGRHSRPAGHELAAQGVQDRPGLRVLLGAHPGEALEAADPEEPAGGLDGQGGLALPAGAQEGHGGSRAGQHSIRINQQWRLCFVWRDGDAYDVEIVDYH